jgi:DNA-binding protein HU-beta
MAGAKKPMTKSQITTHFAEKFTLPKKVVGAFLEELAALAADQTKKLGAFTLPGIGKLTKAKRKARVGRNPATGETIKIPAKTVVKARLAKAFKETVAPGGK